MIPSLFELTTFCQNQPQDCLIYQQKEEVISISQTSNEREDEAKSAIS